MADPSGRAVEGVGLRPLACWGCGFESRPGHGCLSIVGICCQLEVYDGLISRPEESYGVWCVLSVIVKPR